MGLRESELDAAASMLVAETGFRRDRKEMAYILWVAWNRRGAGDLVNVLVPPGVPLWNGSSRYRQLFEDASRSPSWTAARTFAASVYGGRSGFPNPGYKHFVHPVGMPKPGPDGECAPNRVVMDTHVGPRCMPRWIVAGRLVGGALFA